MNSWKNKWHDSCNASMPLIKKIYLDREIKLKELLNEFHDLTFEDQMSKLEFYCTQFGLYSIKFIGVIKKL